MLGTLTSLLALTLGVMPASTEAVSPEIEVIHDFAGNDFILVEGDKTYEIYTSDNVFIEGSNSSNLPYFEEDGEKYYLGPSNYFIADDDLVTNLFTGATFSIEDYEGFSYEILPSIQTRSSTPSGDPNKTYIDNDGYTVINEANYFRNLTNLP